VSNSSSDPGAAIHRLADAPEYVLGYSDVEFERLQRQGALFRPLSEAVFLRAEISTGMNVLDLGCGVGDVSLIAADLVGPSGSVLGVDKSPESVDIAKQRLAAAGKSWVRFATTDIDRFTTETGFDAVIGRFVLMYQRDPAMTLRRVSAFLRPNGILAFHEMCMPMARCVPTGALFRRTLDWIIATFERAGVEVDMGAKLAQTFAAAGLPQPQFTADAVVADGRDLRPFENFAGVMRSLLPAAARFGMVSASEVQIETLAERMRDEAVALNATVFSPTLVGAWVRLPESAGRQDQKAVAQ